MSTVYNKDRPYFIYVKVTGNDGQRVLLIGKALNEAEAEDAKRENFVAGWFPTQERASITLKEIAPYKVVCGFMWNFADNGKPMDYSHSYATKAPHIVPYDYSISRSESILFEGTEELCKEFLENINKKNSKTEIKENSASPLNEMLDGLTEEQIQGLKNLSDKYKTFNSNHDKLLDKALDVMAEQPYNGNATESERRQLFKQGVEWLADEILYHFSDHMYYQSKDLISSFGVDVEKLPLYTGKETPYSKIHAVQCGKRK